jgi:hypothetical protein
MTPQTFGQIFPEMTMVSNFSAEKEKNESTGGGTLLNSSKIIVKMLAFWYNLCSQASFRGKFVQSLRSR